MLPKTKRGWKRLLCYARHRCVECGKKTYLDPWRHVGGAQGRVCMSCGGIEYPRGAIHALLLNREALRSQD